jgi:lipopolysaccharide biosynthesis regulator YciM
MGEYTLIAVFAALLVGLAVGKAWERYKLRDGRWVDRRRLRETPHYLLGLHFLTEGQPEQAIEELTQAASLGGDAFEMQLMLGNLHRHKGQVGRAIAIHQSMLRRPDLTRLEHAHCLLCLGLDFRHGGFVDRAIEAFQQVLALDSRNRYALVHLQKLHEDQHQWAEAAAVRERLAALDPAPGAEDRQILAFLRSEIGAAQARSGAHDAAETSFRHALEIDAQAVPAYLALGDLYEGQGRVPESVDMWERLVRTMPDRAHLVFERLERAYSRMGAPDRFRELCERLIALQSQDWRARLALSRHLTGAGRHREAFELLLDAVPHNPHGLVVHQATWNVLEALHLDPALVHRYVTLARSAVFYLDPHLCIRCRYRSTELLWQCPQCHEWNTFVEERIGPAREAPAAEIAGE